MAVLAQASRHQRRQGGWDVAVSPEFFFHFLELKIASLAAFLVPFCKFVYDAWVALGRSFWLNCSGKQREPARS